MKPDWKDAPEWANYLAMDKSGSWFWYEDEPWTGSELWWNIGKCQEANKKDARWKDSLEKRPSDNTSSDDV